MNYVYIIMDKGSLDCEIAFPTLKQAEIGAKMLYHEDVLKGDRTKIVKLPLMDIEKELKSK